MTRRRWLSDAAYADLVALMVWKAAPWQIVLLAVSGGIGLTLLS